MILSTLLGSCVSVCLFDVEHSVMGMNHFLLAYSHPDKKQSLIDSQAGRYGMFAMDLLINGLLSQGAQRRSLKAKAFGGGNVLKSTAQNIPSRFKIGEVNADFVRKYLEADGIPLVAEDLGGEVGRQIHFDGHDYSVYVRKINMQHTHRIAESEHAYFHSTLKMQRKSVKADFW